MKLHHVLATAAVTAVIGPLALFVAPAAYATAAPPAAEAPAAPSAPSASPADSGPSAPSAPSAPTTAPEPSTTAGAGGEEQLPAEESTGKAPLNGAADPTASGPATPTTEPSPTYTRPTFCTGIPDEERGKTSLQGLPSEIVSGSGWHDFAYRVTNVSKVKVMETDVTLDLGTADPNLDDIAELGVTVEWFNSDTGTWKPIEGEGADVLGSQDFATVKTLAPGEYADAKMRIKISEQAKPGTGYFFTIGHSYGEDGQCGFDDISQFDFTVLAPGSEPGKVSDSTGKPGKAENTTGLRAGGTQGDGNRPVPQGELDEIPVSGRLAETGSSSALPTTTAGGAAALVLGAGTVFVVRRRKAGSASS